MRSWLNVPQKPMLPDRRERDLIEDVRSCRADAARGAHLMATRLAPRRRRRCAFATFPAALGVAAPPARRHADAARVHAAYHAPGSYGFSRAKLPLGHTRSLWRASLFWRANHVSGAEDVQIFAYDLAHSAALGSAHGQDEDARAQEHLDWFFTQEHHLVVLHWRARRSTQRLPEVVLTRRPSQCIIH